MAVRFDASGDRLYTTANPPAANAYTLCGWAVLVSDINTTGAVCAVEDGLTSALTTQCIATDTDGTTIRIYSGGGFSSGSFVPGVGTPFFWSMTATSTGGNGVTGRFRTNTQNTFTSFQVRGNSYAPTHIFIGNDSYSEYWPGDAWNVKQWNRALSAEELLIESYYQRPMFPASLNFWWPLHNANDTADRSGNGRNPTVGGTLTTEDTFVGLWTPSRKIFLPAAASGGAQTLEPPLTTRTRTVYAPTVTAGAVTLQPPLTARTRTIYAPTVAPGAVTLQPPLTTRSRTVYAPTVAPGAVTLQPPLTTRARVVYAPVVSQDGGTQTLEPPLTIRARTVYAPVVVPDAVTLLPPLTTRVRVVYAPTVTTSITISPPLTTRIRTVYAPTVAPGAVTLLSPLISRNRIIYFPEVTGGDAPVAAGGLFLPIVRRRRR